tara:strand:+ start:834 stop:1055 length:222 start_codon:yes stop_codon:yes gene_type:complete
MNKFKNTDNKIKILNALYTLLTSILSSSIFGFFVIFFFIDWLGKTDFLSWQMFVQIVGVAFGGVILIQHGKKN